MDNQELMQARWFTIGLRNQFLPTDRDIRDAGELMKKVGDILSNPVDEVAITDTDFITERDLAPYEACVLYGVLKAESDVRMLLASIYYTQKSSMQIFSLTVLKSIAARTNEVINRLTSIANENPQIKVIVPFYGYKNTIVGTIHQYEVALDVVNALLKEKPTEQWINDSVSQGFLQSDSFVSHIALMEFNNVFLDLYKLYTVLGESGKEQYAQAVLEEIKRRGYLDEPYSPNSEDTYYRTLLVGKYPQSLKNKKTATDSDIDLIDKVGVLLYMLYNYEIDNIVLTRIAHYAFSDKPYNKERESANTEYTYFSHPSRITAKYDRLRYIESELLKYGFTEEEFNKITTEIDRKKK